MIKIYNRKTKTYEIEKVSGEKYLNWIYSTKFGSSFLELFIKKKLFSYIYGKYCDMGSSKNKIKKFIDDFNINIEESVTRTDDFISFNDFFTRKLHLKDRPIEKVTSALISPGDGRVIVYENINLEKIVEVKGFNYSLHDLIPDKAIAEKYNNGSMIILRLCPTDYHRFHFIDSGICEHTSKVKGSYYSVNPIALSKIPTIFCKNKREWSIFHSDNFGDVLYMEVGATCVGSIIQSYTPDKRVDKGDEKGYFKFGGSTVILFLEKNKVKIDEDILFQSNLGYECKVLMGEKIGIKHSS
ncbi:phosphatidylserine decarboxylase [Clostridium pascui]|uniref:phosphatidylserine decarboxylase n=1 Tax=Clostridium pascui TaxID=46609 RepID=UPI00195C60FA|nr:phosphatidylserine decarboxylase [Clostridium pascui]MBM7872257.1 phosphatidylserine decarboxylase [Clostridium pascui]